MEKVCVTFVTEEVDTLLKPHGIENVYGAEKQLRLSKYIVFVPRIRESLLTSIPEGLETKILIGKIAYVTDMEMSLKKSRRLVVLSEYAFQFVPDHLVRRFQVKPPTTYVDLKEFPIYLDGLEFTKVERPKTGVQAITKVNATIEEAKRAIAHSMGLDPSAITLKIEINA